MQEYEATKRQHAETAQEMKKQVGHTLPPSRSCVAYIQGLCTARNVIAKSRALIIIYQMRHEAFLP